MMALARLSDYLIPLLLAGAAVYALGRRVDVFSALTTGAGEGLHLSLIHIWSMALSGRKR